MAECAWEVIFVLVDVSLAFICESRAGGTFLISLSDHFLFFFFLTSFDWMSRVGVRDYNFALISFSACSRSTRFNIFPLAFLGICFDQYLGADYPEKLGA